MKIFGQKFKRELGEGAGFLVSINSQFVSFG